MSLTKTIFNNSHYNASLLGDKLIISCNRRQFGKILEGENAVSWGNAIETAIDRQEAHALCRAIIQS